jgi:hypothetical protein
MLIWKKKKSIIFILVSATRSIISWFVPQASNPKSWTLTSVLDAKQYVLNELPQGLKLDHQSILTALNRKVATLEKDSDELSVPVTENNKEIK